MATTYVFSTDRGRFIVNDERSELGFGYPRVFVEIASNGEDNRYLNADLFLGACFNQKREEFESWIDGTEVRDADFDSVCEIVGINAQALMDFVNMVQEPST